MESARIKRTDEEVLALLNEIAEMPIERQGWWFRTIERMEENDKLIEELESLHETANKKLDRIEELLGVSD